LPAKRCSKESQKLLFVTKVAQKLPEKKIVALSFICTDAKICKLFNKVRFLSIFVQSCGVTALLNNSVLNYKEKMYEKRLRIYININQIVKILHLC